MFSRKLKTHCCTATARIIRGQDWLLYSVRPYSRPVRAAVAVKPGKNGPTGKRNAPRMSASILMIMAGMGPYRIPATTTGIKSRLILMLWVGRMVRNWAMTISSAIRTPMAASSLGVNLIFGMIKLLS